jgi:beta-galactosidase
MLGVCYFPEHWPEDRWAADAAAMAEMGLTYVRMGEFAWSAIEPAPGRFDWGWYDRAIDTLAAAGLKLVLCTPTATPPKWLVDARPDILAWDAEGRPRRFGSRRHYCFSSATYRAESRRITSAVAGRYGAHPAVVGWQTDNEYGCHDTVLSWSPAAAAAFRAWLQDRYGTIDALNAAWGNRFWSMEYGSFDQVDPPNLAVTETNPAHRLDFRRFSSDQIAAFNAEQVAILRRLSPGRFVTHNFMGRTFGFDHYDVAADLDLASWDSYPLGFTEAFFPFDDDAKQRWATSGHPDIAAIHHDLYRSVGRGRFWIMEQQPGPVNWAPWNPAPAPGMIRLWTWQALAHGAEVVSYFRWRQAPFAQEQMHAGLNRPDGVRDTGGEEAAAVARELATLPLPPRGQAPVALVVDYPAFWVTEIQPQGADFALPDLVFQWYEALRRLGQDVDMVRAGDPLDGYACAVVPSLPIVGDRAAAAFRAFGGPILFGPRTGSKTDSFHIPADLPPGPLADLLGVRVTRVESLRPGLARAIAWGNRRFAAERWVERVELRGDATPLAAFEDGTPALVETAAGRAYLACWPDHAFLQEVMGQLLDRAGLIAAPLPPDIRLTRRGDLVFAFNFGAEPAPAPAPEGVEMLVGGRRIGARDLAVWRQP